MKSILNLALIITFIASCSPEKSPETDQSQIERIITDYCKATNDRRAEDIPDLLFPDVFSENMTKLSVVEMFYKQLDATEKFEITNLKFEEGAILLEDTGSIKVFCQKYTSETTIALKDGSPINVFKALTQEALNSDPSAEIDEENLTLKYRDRKKLVIVNHAGKHYLVPDAFFVNLDTDYFDAAKVLNKYITA